MNSSILEVVIKARDEASSVLNSFGDKAKSLEPTFQKMAVAGSVAFTGIATSIGLAVSKAADMEQIEVSFSTMLKSAEKAKDMMGELNNFAAKTPYEFEEIAKSSKSLLAFGVPAEDMISQLTAIGDISSGIGAPIGEIAELYGKAKVQGRLFGEDINQLTGRGIPIIQELAKQFNVSQGEVKKLVEQGKVGFPELEKAFKDMTSSGGQFENMMKNQSETFNGMMSTLKDSVNLTMVSIGQQFLPVLKQIMEAVAPVLDGVRQWVAENPSLTAGILTLTLALSGIVAVVGLVGLALPAIITAINPFTVAIALVTAGIASFVASGGDITPLIDGLKETFDRLVSGVSNLINYVKMLWDTFQKSEVATFLNTIFQMLWATLKDLWAQFKELWDIIEPVFMPLLKLLAVVVGGVVITALTAFVVSLTAIAKGLSWLIELLTPLVKIISEALVWAFNAANSAIQTFMGWIDSVIGKINALIELAQRAASAVSGLFSSGNSSAPATSTASYGGAKASGGSVYAGNYYLVGERGPELFAPNATGQIIPNTGGSTTINISGNTFLGEEDVANKIGSAILNQLQFQVKI